MEVEKMIQHMRDLGWAIGAVPPGDIPVDANRSHIESLMEDRAYDHLSTFGDDDNEQVYPEEEDFEDKMTDSEADADTLKSAGWGTDEDYNNWEF